MIGGTIRCLYGKRAAQLFIVSAAGRFMCMRYHISATQDTQFCAAIRAAMSRLCLSALTATLQLEKIYCRKDHFELGYIGCRRRIEELLAFNQAEFEALHPSDGKHFIEKQRVLLGILNRIEEMASTGCISCSCGHNDISAELKGNHIVLSCSNCGSYYTIRAKKISDLAHMGRYIDLLMPGMAKDR